ncbi:cytochrome P450 [Serendipita vermifera]|nr:cytochrome P450 [Serendipita vermifera]
MLAEVSPSSFAIGSALTIGAVVAHNYWRYRQVLKSVGYAPGVRSIVCTTRLIMTVLPGWKFPFSKWYFSVGLDYWAHQRYDLFAEAGQDVISSVGFDWSPAAIMVADAEVAHEIFGNRAKWYKPVDAYGVLDICGRNVLTTEFDIWRTHRRITAPAFSENNNRLVCTEATHTMQELFDMWGDQNSVNFENITGLFVQITLSIICSAGFGMRVPWKETERPAGHDLSFKEAMQIVSGDIYWKIVIPDALMSITKRTARVQLGFTELVRYMREMMKERAKSYRDHNDLFSNLMAANAEDNEDLSLTEEEVIGNIFIFLIAGHETSSVSLGFTIALLALHPEIQEKLYNHIVKNVSDTSGAPAYSELSSLSYVIAVFYESLRLFPPVTLVPKRNAEDTTLQTVNRKGETIVVPVPKGTNVNILTVALHRNPKYWPNPDKFIPERFLGDWPKKAFAPFSLGARACMGRR